MSQLLENCDCQQFSLSTACEEDRAPRNKPCKPILEVLVWQIRIMNQIMHKASKIADGFYSGSVEVSFTFQKVNSNNTANGPEQVRMKEEGKSIRLTAVAMNRIASL